MADRRPCLHSARCDVPRRPGPTAAGPRGVLRGAAGCPWLPPSGPLAVPSIRHVSGTKGPTSTLQRVSRSCGESPEATDGLFAQRRFWSPAAPLGVPLGNRAQGASPIVPVDLPGLASETKVSSFPETMNNGLQVLVHTPRQASPSTGGWGLWPSCSAHQVFCQTL